jgi:hypothetical protein
MQGGSRVTFPNSRNESLTRFIQVHQLMTGPLAPRLDVQAKRRVIRHDSELRTSFDFFDELRQANDGHRTFEAGEVGCIFSRRHGNQ